MAKTTPLHDPLAAAHLLAVADEMTSLVRHELRNKFASVRSAAFYVRRRLRNTEAWQSDPRLEEVSAVIQEEMQLANALLDPTHQAQHMFARNVASVAARTCVERAVECVRNPNGAEREIRIDTEAATVLVDASELALAIRCLIENALEATDGHDPVLVRGTADDALYRIEVIDSGKGIVTAERDNVLRAFHTTKAGHLGLGLNVARRIAQRYGGDVRIGDSAVGSVVVLDVQHNARGKHDERSIGR